MTIFRVNLEEDPKVVKHLKDKEVYQDLPPELRKGALIFFNELSETRRKLEAVKTEGKRTISRSREIYKICDKELKKKEYNKKQRELLIYLRKMSYDLTNEFKKLGFK